METLIELYEYRTKDCCSDFTAADLLNIEKFLKKNKLDFTFKITPSALEAKSWVGAVKCGKIQIQVLPKLLSTSEIDRKVILQNLLFMLSYTRNLEVQTTDGSKLTTSKNPFLEILIKEFADSLFEGLRKYSPKSYIRKEENLNFIKGKLRISENLKYNIANQAKCFCEYDEFSENNLLNQLFYFVSTYLSNITQNNDTKKKLTLIKNFYSEIDFVYFNSLKASRIKLFRNQRIFEKPLKLARMFLEHTSIDMSSNKIKNIALLWDMNVLFEEFVFEVIKRKIPEFKATAQKGRKLLRYDTSKKRNTFVDILIQHPQNNQKIVIDTKYKEFKSLDDFSNADVFQVSTYCLLHETNQAILLYPEWGANPNIPKCELNTSDPNKHYEIKFKTINLTQNIKKNLPSIINELRNIVNG